MASLGSDDEVDFIEEDDLFGGDEDAQSEHEHERELTDRDLESGDDEERESRAGDGMQGLEQQVGMHDREANVLNATIPRHAVPQPTNGELYTLRIPKFLAVEPRAFNREEFVPPITDHHSTSRSENFSANATARTTIRYRKNPETGELESNTVFSRWSDGSATIAVGDKVYEITSKSLAPSTKDGRGYHDVLDSHQYVATPYSATQLLQIVGHVTTQFDVRPDKMIEDDALEKLQSQLAALTRGKSKADVKDAIALVQSHQDPELQKKQAEMAEKERMKAQRRRETAAARADQQTSRVRHAVGGGLSLDDLEGRSRTSASRKKRPAPSGPRRARRRADSDTDEDGDMRGGRNREDEYDLEDDFLVGSDEEEEVVEDDDSEEEIDDEEEEEAPKAKKQKTSNGVAEVKRKSEPDSDMDAEGEDENEVAMQLPASAPTVTDIAGGRGRNRNIIEDDDDE